MGDSATAAVAPQHLRALEHANRVRLARADLKRRIGAGEVTVAEVVANHPAEVSGMSISDLLMSQRRWGRARCRRLLLTLGVPENKRIGTFTDRQRMLVAQLLAEKGNPCAEQAPPLGMERVEARRLAPVA
jgi:hypothetical protein